MVKQILGIIFLCTFIGFMAHKFYKVVGQKQDAALITFISLVILLVILLGVRKVLADR